QKRLFEPLAWIAYLYQRLIWIARQRQPMPIIAGVVERGELREFSEKVLLERVFRGLRSKGNANYLKVLSISWTVIGKLLGKSMKNLSPRPRLIGGPFLKSSFPPLE